MRSISTIRMGVALFAVLFTASFPAKAGADADWKAITSHTAEVEDTALR